MENKTLKSKNFEFKKVDPKVKKILSQSVVIPNKCVFLADLDITTSNILGDLDESICPN